MAENVRYELLLATLTELERKHRDLYPSFGSKVLTWTGTTSTPGSAPAMAVRRLRWLRPDSSSSHLDVFLEGELPRPLATGEWVTVSMTSLPTFQGYQVKTQPLAGPELLSNCVGEQDGALVVHGHQVFTVHHTPHTANYFEKIPFEDVSTALAGVKYGIVAVGRQANISPRFVFHFEAVPGGVALFHADQKLNKTFMNLQKNRTETRLVMDLETLRGWLLTGEVQEFARKDHPTAMAKIDQAFAAGGLGAPNRCYRLLVHQAEQFSLT